MLSELLNEQALQDCREEQVKKFNGLDRMLYKITLLAITKGIEHYRLELHRLPLLQSTEVICKKSSFSDPKTNEKNEIKKVKERRPKPPRFFDGGQQEERNQRVTKPASPCA